MQTPGMAAHPAGSLNVATTCIQPWGLAFFRIAGPRDRRKAELLLRQFSTVSLFQSIAGVESDVI